ncbi:MAG: response regulator transcription factor [Acidobacteria bacterium]|nr:response regulator transcription factor [Acidobacteriota bacterium]
MRVVLVEDDPLLRNNIVLLLKGEPGITIQNSFGSAEEALVSFPDPASEIMLVDIGLPGMSGIDLIRQVKSRKPEIEIMAHTVFEDRKSVFSALKAGASGYLLKGSTPRELIEALFNLYNGGAPMSPKIARAVIREFQEDGIEESYLLSQREQQILSSLEKGLTYKEIASAFNISPHTVHTHIKNIYEKLQAKSRQEAFVKARRKGIL